MASTYTHLAIAKRFIEKARDSGHVVLNERDFYDGSVMPDISGDKYKSHYSNFDKITKKNLSLLEWSKNKINFSKFLAENIVDTDFQKGAFLHLITDYLWANEFFSEDYLNKTSRAEYSQNLIYSSVLSTPYLEKKYDLNYELTSVKEKLLELYRDLVKRAELKPGKLAYEFSELDKFIERVSSINLDEWRGRF